MFKILPKEYMPEDSFMLTTGKEAILVNKSGTMFHFKDSGEVEVTFSNKIIKLKYHLDKVCGLPIID